jgi:transcriptional regulator with XRE-family HTH domain
MGDVDSIGQWVRAARKYVHWTQSQLADEMGVTKANVSHWEGGNHDPSFRQLVRIKRLTGYPLPEIGPPVAWPFPLVQREAVFALTPQELLAVQAGLRGILQALADIRNANPAASAS